MIAYASRTGTKRNLAALRKAEWRLLVSARGAHRSEGFRYALDNGAWTSYQRGEPFDEAAFSHLLDTHAQGADWVVLPDIVGAGTRSLEFSVCWFGRVKDAGAQKVLLAVQDGMTPADVGSMLGPDVGIFLGGTTEWKLSTMAQWGEFARQARCHYHVARVNSRRRIVMAGACGAHSFDGSSASRYSSVVPLLDWSRRQESFQWEAHLCPQG